MKNAIKRVVVGLAAVLIGGLAFIWVSAYWTYHTAKERLAEFKELDLSKNPAAQSEALHRKYGTKLHPLENCTQGLCRYEIDLSNHFVAALHIIPYTEMNIRFTMYEGSLDIAMLE